MSPDRVSELALIRSVRRRITTLPGSGVRLGIGDDCAVLEPTPGALLLVTTDLLLEDIHFRRRYATPTDIGWKAMAVNLSDIAAMGGRARWALLALACGAETTAAEVDIFYDGVLELGNAHGVTVVGGDTTASPGGWLVNVTVIGETESPPLRRDGARPGDVIAVTGTLGRSGAGFALLDRSVPAPALPPAVISDVRQAHLRPVPRLREGHWLARAGGVTAMIDLSDGLRTDLSHIVEESHVGATVEISRLPLADTTRAVGRALDSEPLGWATSAGEDYELLLTCAPGAYGELAEGLARATGTALTRVGSITEPGRGLRVVDASGREVPVTPGFEHFVTWAQRE